jgi:hypothetical protein
MSGEGGKRGAGGAPRGNSAKRGRWYRVRVHGVASARSRTAAAAARDRSLDSARAREGARSRPTLPDRLAHP